MLLIGGVILSLKISDIGFVCRRRLIFKLLGLLN